MITIVSNTLIVLIENENIVKQNRNIIIGIIAYSNLGA
jgi:hypothetical protein